MRTAAVNRVEPSHAWAIDARALNSSTKMRQCFMLITGQRCFGRFYVRVRGIVDKLDAL